MKKIVVLLPYLCDVNERELERMGSFSYITFVKISMEDNPLRLL